MSLKGLNQFVKFDIEEFFKGKVLVATGIKPWVDFNTKQHNGTDIKVTILEDGTQYTFKEGETFSNIYESFSLKVKKDIDVPMGARVIPVNAVATVYGDFKNQLSVRCESVQIVAPKEK